ncbi:hypothetical protein L21SP2_2567 [Salinispira pacifica]|uniref:Uncharacterized protein n=1 Tax=Salinispira pacifica TaxID=1307761 RepID=V5WK03_9SPIO|nr:hypothetical protein L21SP2_2567 [Salinispira pacifica]
MRINISEAFPGYITWERKNHRPGRLRLPGMKMKKNRKTA